MSLNHTFWELLVALGLGLLTGLQKERAGPLLAGLRTFALITVFGAVTAILAETTGPWIIIAGLLSMTALLVTGNAMAAAEGRADPGQTTEVAVVLMFLVGALCVIGPLELAIVLGGAVAVLLHLKEELRGLVARLSDKDVRAVMQFVVISLIILPVLPNQAYGPFQVLNPRNIWFMVVLIVGLNLVGYAAFRTLGSRAGTALAGFLGGIISSTATTVSYARTTKTDPGRAGTAAVVVWIASGVVFVRILLEVAAVAPGFVSTVAGPMGVMLALFVVSAAVIWRSATSPSDSPMDPGNPSELKPAIAFAAMYAVILLAVAAAEEYLGGAGLYAAAFISGLTDIDAITLSTSNLVAGARLEADTGWRLILVAAMSNLLFKTAMVATLGSRQMLRRIGGLVGIALVAGVGLLLFW
ncbi:MAG: MgtC/SapB family protein [Gemmatimonadota bacterium]